MIPKKSKHKNAEKYRKYGNYQAKWEIIQCQQKYFPRVAFFFFEVLLLDLEMHYKIDYAEHHGTQNHDCQIVDKPKEITVIPMADTSAYPQTVVVKPQHTRPTAISLQHNINYVFLRPSVYRQLLAM